MSLCKVHPLVAALAFGGNEEVVGVLERFCVGASGDALLDAVVELDAFAQRPDANLYQRIRALFQSYAIYRFYLPSRVELAPGGELPAHVPELIQERRFREAMTALHAHAGRLTELSVSTLATAYHGLGFQMLASLVQRSVRSLKGNRWMFRTSHALDHPLRVRPELVRPDADGWFPLLVERTPVRLDLSHCGWSDIFFLGMDYPEGARVLNMSVDLAVSGRDPYPVPPITCYLRVIDKPVLRLCSVDLAGHAELTDTAELFDYGKDHLGLLKAAVIASGIVPPGLEASGQPLGPLLEQLLGPARGLELVSHVNQVPKGSRLAVSTNLLAGLISVCMRATGQVGNLEGPPTETERRIIAGRAILGEWLAGSGGGWQDTAGLWAGIKLIEGVRAQPGDIEHGSSRGCLLPRHTLLGQHQISDRAREALLRSIVMVHGGMAANVGPVLELVTEKFLLGSSREWRARQELLQLFDALLRAFAAADIKQLAGLTTEAFRGPLQTIIPSASNSYTERLIAGAHQAFGERFWGFWMMGGMSGGGMGFLFDPAIQHEAEAAMLDAMQGAKRELEHSLPFAMDPVIYRTSINDVGTTCAVRIGQSAILAPGYYLLMLPHWTRAGAASLSDRRRREIAAFSARDLVGAGAERVGKELLERMLPMTVTEHTGASLEQLLSEYGFDAGLHEQVRLDLRSGRIGIAKNRLSPDVSIEDVAPEHLVRLERIASGTIEVGRRALAALEACTVTLAGGSGTRWNQGAAVVKALFPFAKIGGCFRTFAEAHLAKTRRTGREYGNRPPHVFTTGLFTHAPIRRTLERERAYGLASSTWLSRGQAIGLRTVPMMRDLELFWQHTGQQRLEQRKQKVRDGQRRALMSWAQSAGEGSDYRDNTPVQCLHPVGHWYEVANLLLSGTLERLLVQQPQLKYMLLHNIDTLGAALDPRCLGQHIESRNALTFEVVPRRFDDRGGGLARVGGRLRLIESLALPRERDELSLSHYSSLTTWISIHPLLEAFGLERSSLRDPQAVRRGVSALAARMPTYVTLKETKRRWGHAQEDVLVVSQFEKLWGDMSALPDLQVGYLVVPRMRGQQLKEVSQIDTWLRDGSREYVEALCDFAVADEPAKSDLFAWSESRLDLQPVV